ncbi:MAG: hypothetical protein ACI81W_001694 [Saprospiraceae bacterium]|jgi:hypothetical protein
MAQYPNLKCFKIGFWDGLSPCEVGGGLFLFEHIKRFPTDFFLPTYFLTAPNVSVGTHQEGIGAYTLNPIGIKPKVKNAGLNHFFLMLNNSRSFLLEFCKPFLSKGIF